MAEHAHSARTLNQKPVVYWLEMVLGAFFVFDGMQALLGGVLAQGLADIGLGLVLAGLGFEGRQLALSNHGSSGARLLQASGFVLVAGGVLWKFMT